MYVNVNSAFWALREIVEKATGRADMGKNGCGYISEVTVAALRLIIFQVIALKDFFTSFTLS